MNEDSDICEVLSTVMISLHGLFDKVINISKQST